MSEKTKEKGLLASIMERDPAARNPFEILLCYPGVHAILWHRAAHFFYQRNLKLFARLISQLSRFLTGIEIHPGAVIGRRLLIDHGSGVVIGETSVIGDDCTIYQGVTLGGTGKHTGKRHPTLGNHVMVSAGARVLGPIIIGDYSKIGSGAVVLKDVPSNCTAVGVPAKIVIRDNVRIDDLDQTTMPDPMAQELECLRERVMHLEKIVNKLTEGEKNHATL